MQRHVRDTGLLSKAKHGEWWFRRELMRTSHALARIGFVPGCCGNLSVRLASGNILVTPTGLGKAALLAADPVLVSAQGKVLRGTRKPTSELQLHLAIYAMRTDVQAIVHAHPPISTAFACSGVALDQVLCQEAVMVLGRVPLARYATTGTCEVTGHLIPLLHTSDTILLANHGAVCCGSNLRQALQRMEVLEHTAQIHLHALQIGSPKYLDQDQITSLQQARLRYDANTPVHTIRAGQQV